MLIWTYFLSICNKKWMIFHPHGLVASLSVIWLESWDGERKRETHNVFSNWATMLTITQPGLDKRLIHATRPKRTNAQGIESVSRSNHFSVSHFQFCHYSVWKLYCVCVCMWLYASPTITPDSFLYQTLWFVFGVFSFVLFLLKIYMLNKLLQYV